MPPLPPGAQSSLLPTHPISLVCGVLGLVRHHKPSFHHQQPCDTGLAPRSFCISWARKSNPPCQKYGIRCDITHPAAHFEVAHAGIGRCYRVRLPIARIQHASSEFSGTAWQELGCHNPPLPPIFSRVLPPPGSTDADRPPGNPCANVPQWHR